MKKERREQRGKQQKYQHNYQNIPYQNQNFISISRKNIVPLGGWRMWGGKEKNSLLERDEHRTPTLWNTAEKTGHLCWMTSNPMNDVLNRLIVGAKEESLVALVDDGGFVKVESRLVVNGNPPEFFYFVAEMLAIEEIDHPLHAHKTALQ